MQGKKVVEQGDLPPAEVMPDPAPKHSAPAPSVPDRIEIDLPSGRKAQMVRNGKGKHVKIACRIVGQNAGQWEMSMGLVVAKCLIDGKPITYEGLDDLEDMDLVVLMGKVLSGKDAGLPPST